MYITHFGFAFIKRTKESESLFYRKRQQERFPLFCKKTSNLHEKPKSEFPTLKNGYKQDSIRKMAMTNLVTLALYKIFFVVFLFLPNKKSLSSLNTSLKRNKLNKNNIVGSLALILFVLLFFVDMFIKVSSTVHITVGFADL